MSLISDKIQLTTKEAEVQIQKNLNRFPPLLKWTIIFCVLMIVPGYFIAKQISYTISKNSLKNKLVTARPSFQNALPPKVEKIQIFNWSGNIYSVLAVVSNPNLELSVPNTHYKFIFFNEKNSQILPESGLTEGDISLVADKTQNIALPRIISKEKITRAEIQFSSNINWQKRLSVPTARLFATAPNFINSSNPYEFRVTGFIENLSIYELGQVKILLLVKDFTGKIISLSERSEFSLKTGERRSYTQIWPNVNFINAASIEVIPETDVLNLENLKLPIGQDPTDSSLDRPSTDRYR